MYLLLFYLLRTTGILTQKRQQEYLKLCNRDSMKQQKVDKASGNLYPGKDFEMGTTPQHLVQSDRYPTHFITFSV